MPPEDRFVPRFAAEPPQDLLPYGRWSQTLHAGVPGRLPAHRQRGRGPRRARRGDLVPGPHLARAHVRARRPRGPPSGYELYGYVSFAPGGDGEEPGEFHAVADYTAETAEANPDWQIDLCDEVVGTWRGEQGKAAAMTLVWGRPLVDGGAVVTGELADLAVDQCVLLEGRFTLIAPDDYRGDTLDVKVYDRRGDELAHESLYAEDDDEDDEDARWSSRRPSAPAARTRPTAASPSTARRWPSCSSSAAGRPTTT